MPARIAPEPLLEFTGMGTQRFSLMKNVSDSLAGRLAVLEMTGLSAQEVAGTPDRGHFKPPGWRLTSPPISEPELFDRIWRGGFPELAANPSLDPELFYSSYVATYLQRDVRDLAHVGDLTDFQRFMSLLAGRTAQILNLGQLGNDLNIPYKRLTAWLSILEASGIIYWLEPYYANAGQRLTKSPKLYFSDTGLAAALARFKSPEQLMTGAASGAFLETYVVGEIRKSYLSAGRVPPLWLYRTMDQKELDLIIIEAGTVYPMDVKQAARLDRRYARTMEIAAKLKLEQGPGLVIAPTPAPYPLSSWVDAYPAGWL